MASNVYISFYGWNIGQFASENVDFLKCSVKAVFVSL